MIISKKIFTLCVVHEPGRVLLGMKKRGFGVGRWNGFGGKVSSAETIEEAARRELTEEAGIEAKHLEKMGVVDFEFRNGHDILEVHIFKVKDFLGEPSESEEMRPQWFNIKDIPFSQMWSDDIYWFPFFLEDKKFKGRVLFDESDMVLEHEIFEVSQEDIKILTGNK